MQPKSKNSSYRSALTATICIFFFWGFAASGNALFIPVLKQQFSLGQFQSQLVELSFYAAYFTGSLLYFLISIKKSNWLATLGSKKVMAAGLTLSACGTISLALATGVHSYILFLASLFIIALGFSFQQIIANPLLIMLGDEKSGANRLILAGAINSFGNTIAPLVLSYFIFGKLSSSGNLSLIAVKPLFFAIAILYVLFACWFYSVKLPATLYTVKDQVTDMGAFRFPQLLLGMVAIFCYVGCEVTIQGNLPALVADAEIMGLPADKAIHYFSLFGGSLLIGRWTGALFMFNLNKTLTNILLFIVPITAFSVVLAVNFINGSNLSHLITYTPFIFITSLILLLSNQKTEKILFFSAITSILLIVFSLTVDGRLSMFCIISIAMLSALLWPCIFSLAISGLGKYKQQGSSLLVMMIVGGALFPPIQGFISDLPTIGIRLSFLLPALGYCYIAWYALTAKKRDNFTTLHSEDPERCAIEKEDKKSIKNQTAPLEI
ncbi:hypothetical protein [Pedobacter nyackensis]|uniref:hypothetical protein n=1 Tax=Pedobacter nyackensis TaxID=475255 RepID=UPI0029307AB1|nr:hypothetical protein [Pedobacter nyackensis]